MIQQPTSEYISKGTEGRLSKRYCVSTFTAALINNSQEAEATQKSIDG